MRAGVYIAAGGAVLAAAVWAATRVNKETGYQVGGAIVDMADGLVSGAVVQTGKIFGIPATNMTECERAKAEGRTWDASFACPAVDFIKYVWN